MVKKKSPVVPLTFVVIGIAVAFAVNTRMHPVDPKEAAAEQQKLQQQQQQQQSATQVRPADKSSDVHRALAASLQGSAPGKPMMHGPNGPGGPGGDYMTSKKQESVKPKPSATSTNAQWYTNN